MTLLERKILGGCQNRPGPNKVRVWGILQPLGDAAKLFSKRFFSPYKRFTSYFILGPLLAFWLIGLLFIILPISYLFLRVDWSALLLLVILRVGVYPLILRGWGSNRKYSIIGAIRGIAQTISYEIRLSLLFFSLLLLYWSLSIGHLNDLRKGARGALMIACWLPLWVLSCLAETNRTPFDFREGESELVSGFNTEYGGFGFALIFMAEYGIILFFSYMTRTVLLGIQAERIFSSLRAVLLVSFWIWVRGSFPRYRYDKLIDLCWKLVLPISAMCLCFRVITANL